LKGLKPFKSYLIPFHIFNFPKRMNFKYIHKSVLLLALFFVASCGKFADDINVDPNNPSKPSTASMFTEVLRTISGTQANGLMTTTTNVSSTVERSIIGINNANLYVQFLSEKQYTDESRYGTVNYQFAGWYVGPLMDLQSIIDLNTNADTKVSVAASGSANNQIAVARIIKAYIFHFLTDRYGALPYKQALKGNANFSPAYDSQQDIYTDLFKELKEAVAQINEAEPPVKGDILLNGNMATWKRFANSIRATMALRISKVDPAKGKTEFADAVAAGLLTSDLKYTYLGEANNQNPYYDHYFIQKRDDYAVSKTLVDFMLPLNDPRLAAYADKAIDSDTYVGMPYGLINAGTVKKTSVSSLNTTKVRAQTAPLYVMTRAQLLFAQAEAAKMGWISGSAETFYNDAIKASMQQWGVYSDAAYNSFISQASVKYNDAESAKLIGNQKWVALYLQGYEAWAEWRRTGFPALSPAKDALAGRTIPRRHAYPTTERDINGVNYNAAVAAQGADDLSTKLWWDK
jgi:Starch-binding associating with outer membrane